MTAHSDRPEPAKEHVVSLYTAAPRGLSAGTITSLALLTAGSVVGVAQLLQVDAVRDAVRDVLRRPEVVEAARKAADWAIRNLADFAREHIEGYLDTN